MKSNTLSKRLKELRESKGYLQKFVADKIGVRSNTLSGYENGTRSPDPEMIVSLAKLYNVSTDYLLGHSDDPSKQIDDEFLDPEFIEFLQDVRVWYKDAPETKEEELRLMKEMFKHFKNK